MSVLQSVKELFETSKPRGRASGSSGSYWCDDCCTKILASDIEGDIAECPDCGDEMRFERSMKGIQCC